jgi:hypothetical protein
MIGLAISARAAEIFGLFLMAVSIPYALVVSIWAWKLHQANRTRKHIHTYLSLTTPRKMGPRRHV